jgi:putative transposase
VLRRPLESAQYTSFRYTQRLADLGIVASVGSVADAYDNAMAESFVGTLKTELIGGRVFATRFEAEIAVVEYLGWFNHTRLHAALGDVPPAEFKARSPPQNETITSTIMSKETN